MVEDEGQNVSDISYVWYHTLWDLGPNPSGNSGARGGSWDDDTGFVTDPVVLHFRRHATMHLHVAAGWLPERRGPAKILPPDLRYLWVVQK